MIPSSEFIRYDGNDTIDPYPLIPAGAEKVLCITQDTYTAINIAYQAFRESLKKPVAIKPIKQEHKQKIVLSEPKYQRDYEPSNAIQVNECDYRRWCRVSEWFNTYGQGIYE